MVKFGTSLKEFRVPERIGFNPVILVLIMIF